MRIDYFGNARNGPKLKIHGPEKNGEKHRLELTLAAGLTHVTAIRSIRTTSDGRITHKIEIIDEQPENDRYANPATGYDTECVRTVVKKGGGSTLTNLLEHEQDVEARLKQLEENKPDNFKGPVAKVAEKARKLLSVAREERRKVGDIVANQTPHVNRGL